MKERTNKDILMDIVRNEIITTKENEMKERTNKDILKDIIGDIDLLMNTVNTNSPNYPLTDNEMGMELGISSGQVIMLRAMVKGILHKGEQK